MKFPRYKTNLFIWIRNGGGCLMAVVRYVGASGPATIPMAGPAPETRRPGGDGAIPGEAARPGRGGRPSAVPQSYNRCRARACYLLAHFPRRSMPRQDEVGT